MDAYCDRQRLGITERLQIFRAVCAAVQHAHRNLVVHRDIKPANILVTAEGEPKLLDFGIAKLLDAGAGMPLSTPTRTATRLMTPEYASPEQVRGQPITTASDVYSLGVLLYELLTGRRPYRLEGRSLGEMERAITEQQPERPSTAVTRNPPSADAPSTAEVLSDARGVRPSELRRRLAGDLDDIVLMALRKEPERRYASVEQLSEDIRRHLEGLPVVARGDTWSYRAAKFLRRNPWGAAAATVILLLIAGSSVLFFLQARRIAGERDRALAAEQAARMEAQTATQVTDFLVELFEFSSPAEARGREVPVREVLDLGARRVRGELADEPEVQARLMATMSDVYGSLGLHETSLELATEALEREKAIHGERSPEVARSLNRIGGLHRVRGEWDAAEESLQAALEMQRDLLGPRHDDLVDTLNNLGLLRDRQGRYDEALAFHEEALAMAREVHGEEDEKVCGSANNVAQALARKGRYEESSAMHRKNLAIRREALGEDHPSVGVTLNNLGLVLDKLGHHGEAEAALRENVELTRRLYGEASIAHGVALNNLASSLKEQGRAAEAEPLQLRAVEICRDRLGTEHPETLARMNNLANLYHDQGKLDDAEHIHRTLLEIHRRVLGPHHPATAGTLNNLANLLWDKGAYDEAEPLFRETIEADLDSLGPEHPYVAMDYNNLAVVLRDRGRASDRREAEELFRRAVSISRKALGESHADVAVSLGEYGILLCRTGQAEEGERRIREALGIFQEVHEPDHFQIDMSRSMLGECLTLEGRYDEAEPLVVGGYESLREKLGEGATQSRRARARAVGLYEAWGRPEKAVPFRVAHGQ
ncbi:MAG: tetratricopeptide repeat protein [Acidobacteriota bacterium]